MSGAAAKAAARLSHHDSYSDQLIRAILKQVMTIAMVGASANWNRPSYFAMKYMQEKGYRVIPVNPKIAGSPILAETAHASLADIPDPIDMVQVFRRSDAVMPVAEEAIAVGAKVLWMQLGVRNDEAAARAEQASLRVVMNRCPKIEYGRLSGEIGWLGVNTRVISSRRSRRI